MAVPSVQSVYDRHRLFAILTSVGFAMLYAELGVFAHAAWHTRGDLEAALIIGAAFVMTLAAFLASFAQARAFSALGVERQGSLALPELSAQLGKSAGCVLLASAACLTLYLYLVSFDLSAATTVFNNIYVFSLAGAGLVPVLVTYVRYGALLYALKQDSWVKVLVTSAGLGVIICAAFVFLIGLDIAWLNGVPAEQRGLYSLHVYVRDLYFFTMVLAIYGWHARWMADH
jgi:hypothetical protein